MKRNIIDFNPVKRARLAGLLFVLMAPIGFFGMMYVQSYLVSENINETANNILENELSFRLSMVSSFLMNLDTLVLVLVFYTLFKYVNRKVSIIMVILVCFGACISTLSELNHYAVLKLVQYSNEGLMSLDQTTNLLRLFLDMRFFTSFGIAQIFWSLWLFPLGYLVIKSKFLPKIFGYLLILAGVSYLIKCVVLFINPVFDMTVWDFLTFGEMLFGLWLLIKGIDSKKWNQLYL